MKLCLLNYPKKVVVVVNVVVVKIVDSTGALLYSRDIVSITSRMASCGIMLSI